jgi:hypothetical protein
MTREEKTLPFLVHDAKGELKFWQRVYGIWLLTYYVSIAPVT